MQHLFAFLILSVACSMVVSCIPMHCKHHQPTKKCDQLTKENVDSDLMNSLDESLSRCGKYRIDIRDMTISQFQEHFRSGKLTSAQLTHCYLKRIEKIDVHLKSVIEINPEAISLARKADRERRANSNQPSMHGIPILIKDNIGTRDCMQTTAGALALENVKPKHDADVVRRLRKNGAIILGKSNLSEWASFRDVNAPNGWSGRGGQTISSYVMDADPSGSSTGSAVSVSTNLVTVSLGTETVGSIISPSSRSAVVGLKTTIGSVSTKGVIPLSFVGDVVGPIARSVQDAAILLGTVSDIDMNGCDVDVSSCFPDKNLTIGVLRQTFWSPTDVDMKTLAVLEHCLINLKESKLAQVIDPVISSMKTPEIKEEVASDIIFGHEFKHLINNYLKQNVDHYESELGRNITSLADIIEYNDLNPPNEGYNQSLLKLSEATDGLQNTTYIKARNESREQSILYLDSIFDEYEVDALATPCHFLYSYGAFAGYPSITVPVGVDNTGLPFGMCLLGRPNSEAALLKLGHIIELSRSRERPVPHFI